MSREDRKRPGVSADDVVEGLTHGLGARTQLGPWILHEELGSGGTSVVYRASHFETGQVVALKVLRPEVASDDELVRMFADETRAQTLVSHKNIMRVIETASADGLVWAALQYVHGVTLGEVLVSSDAGEHMPDDVAAWIVAEAAAGVDAVHEMRAPEGSMARLVHRDVNPHNLMIGHDGSVRLFDFGLVFGDGRAHQTEPGVAKVRLRYAAPEQLQSPSERGPLDRRVDVYQLGLTLYELVAGPAFPLSLTDLEVVEKAQGGVIDDVRVRRPDLDVRLSETIRAATRADRDRRTATAGAVREALLPFIRVDSRAQLVHWIDDRCASLLGSRRARAQSFVQ